LEKICTLEGINPVDFFGVNNVYLQILKRYYPKLKIVSRGNDLTLIGDDEVIALFERKLNQLMDYYHRYNTLNENIIEQILLEDPSLKPVTQGDEVLVHGNNGSKIKAKTINQQKLVAEANKHAMVFAVGPAGTGKTSIVGSFVKCLTQLKLKTFKTTQWLFSFQTMAAVGAREEITYRGRQEKERPMKVASTPQH
jgi:phosphate starvation-inducible PhoH-like protein